MLVPSFEPKPKKGCPSYVQVVRLMTADCIVLYCNSLLTKHVTHNINIMHNILKGHRKVFGSNPPIGIFVLQMYVHIHSYHSMKVI